MTSTRLGYLLLVAGVVVAAVSALADPIGLGAADDEFGWRQTVGVVVGVVVAVLGAIALRRGRRREGEPESPEEPA